MMVSSCHDFIAISDLNNSDRSKRGKMVRGICQWQRKLVMQDSRKLVSVKLINKYL